MSNTKDKMQIAELSHGERLCSRFASPEAALASLSNWLYMVWYLEWAIPGICTCFTNGALKTLNPLRVLNILGMFAYASKIYVNMTAILNMLDKKEYINLEGQTYQARRLDKAAFKIYDTAFSSIAYIGLFILNAAWVTPFFIAVGGGFLAKASYSLIKNTKNLYQYSEKSSERLRTIDACIELITNKEKSNVNNISSETDKKLELLNAEKQKILTAKKYHQAKLKRSIFDTVSMVGIFTFSVMFCFNPGLACIGLLAVGIGYTVGRKRLNKKTKQAKLESIQANKTPDAANTDEAAEQSNTTEQVTTSSSNHQKAPPAKFSFVSSLKKSCQNLESAQGLEPAWTSGLTC